MIDLHQPSVYGRQFYVGASHPAKMELFLYGLVSRLEEQKQKLSIKNYEEHKKYSPLRKISWYVVTLSLLLVVDGSFKGGEPKLRV